MRTISTIQKQFIDEKILDPYDSFSAEVLEIAETDDDDFIDEQIRTYRLSNLKEITTSEELHYILLNWNWDDGNEIPEYISKHELCDKGTALMLYWMLDPDYYYSRYDDVNKVEIENLHLLKDVEKRLLSNEYLHKNIRFSPASIARIEERENPKIPSELKVASDGDEFEDLFY